ncbi:hypothetical protein [Subdoligranulum variabile]|nr:hypothetical protein [Subdoligranulum variabile]
MFLAGSRVKLVRLALSLSPAAFGRPLNLSRQQVLQLEECSAPLLPPVEDDLCNTYSVNPQWLHSGQGPMFSAAYGSPLLDRFFAVLTQEHNTFRRRYVESLARMTPQQWAKLEDTIQKEGFPDAQT